jgi:hypothetical protein
VRYTIELSVPANTTTTNPARASVQVAPGTLVQSTVQLPYPSAGQVHTWAERGGHQIVPSNRGASLRGNDTVFVVPESLEISEHPLIIDVYGANDDDAFAHLAIWHFDLLPLAESQQSRSPGLLDGLRRALGV